LKETAVPSIFPNLPSYLSKNISGLNKKDPAGREKSNEERINKLQENFEKNDHIQDFVDTSMSTHFNNTIIDKYFYYLTIY
jgi:hypothetical protein